VGTIIVGKLARPSSAADILAPPGAVNPTELRLDSRVVEALRASFEPIMNEPVPDRLRDMIEKIRSEEQRRRAR